MMTSHTKRFLALVSAAVLILPMAGPVAAASKESEDTPPARTHTAGATKNKSATGKTKTATAEARDTQTLSRPKLRGEAEDDADTEAPKAGIGETKKLRSKTSASQKATPRLAETHASEAHKGKKKTPSLTADNSTDDTPARLVKDKGKTKSAKAAPEPAATSRHAEAGPETRPETGAKSLKSSGVLVASNPEPAYPDGGVTATEVADSLKAAGHAARITRDSTGDPLIEASFPAGGQSVPYKVFFFGCTKGRCASVQYYMALEGDPARAQKWNEDNRYARAYVAGSLVRFEYDVDLEAGATPRSVRHSADRWKSVVASAAAFMNPQAAKP